MFGVLDEPISHELLDPHFIFFIVVVSYERKSFRVKDVLRDLVTTLDFFIKNKLGDQFLLFIYFDHFDEHEFVIFALRRAD